MTNQNNHQRRRFITRLDAQLTVTVLAVMLSTLALLIAYRNERRVKLEVKEGTTVESADAILARANDAAAFADSILSFLEGASALVGVALAIGAWMLRNSIQDQIAKTNEFVARTEQQLADREKHFGEMEESLTHRLDEIISLSHTELHALEKQARNSFRVLSLLVLAEQQVRARNVDTAIRTLQAAYRLEPDNHATNYLLGYLYTFRKDFDKAIELLKHALDLEPDFAPAIAALGLALRRKGDTLTAPEQRAERDRLWAQAETQLLEALGMDTRLTDAEGESYYGTLGGLYRRQHRYDAALQAYEKALQVTPGSSYPITNLATLYKRQGDDENAEHYFRRVIKIAELQLDDNPRDHWTRADYAQAKLVLGQKEEAMSEMRMVLEYVRERGMLETIKSGLKFLSESPTPIEGLDEMIDSIDQVLRVEPGELRDKNHNGG